MTSRLTKEQIQTLKTTLAAWCAERGGSLATIKWHKQCQYVEGFVAVKLSDGNIQKVRLYDDGHVITYTWSGCCHAGHTADRILECDFTGASV